MPFLTVILPTARNDERIPTLIGDGVKRQTFRDFEIIVVDDHVDNCERVHDFAAALEGYDYHHIQSKRQADGLSAVASARNTGLARAKGELVLFVDDLGEWPPNLFESHVRNYKGNGTGMIGLQHRQNAKGRIVFDFRTGKTPHIPALHGWFITCNASMPMSTIKAVNGLDEEYDGVHNYEDLDIGFRAARDGLEYTFTESCPIIRYYSAPYCDKRPGVTRNIERYHETRALIEAGDKDRIRARRGIV